MTSWRATVWWVGSEPAKVELIVEVFSLEVLRGKGGVTRLSGPEKALARSNALKSLDADRFPQIRFQSDDIEKTDDGYRLTGTLEIHNEARRRVIDLRIEDLGNTWRLSCEADVRQSEFGVKPYSRLMGSIAVADDVTVAITVGRAKDD
jgi:polyisoprenoid-binding protein YceI